MIHINWPFGFLYVMIKDPFHALSKKLTFRERIVFYVRSSHETEFRSICPFGSKYLLENDLQTESLHNIMILKCNITNAIGNKILKTFRNVRITSSQAKILLDNLFHTKLSKFYLLASFRIPQSSFQKLKDI